MNKKLLMWLAFFIMIFGLGFMYFTRKAPAPSQDAQAFLDANQMAANEIVETVTNTQTPTLNTTPSASNKTSTRTHYKISSASSKVEFKIDEILRDKPFTAIGTTSDIAGDIFVNSDDTITLSTISINARTFKTDSSNRDGAIARFILKSDDPKNEFITFVPKTITGKLPTVSVTGDLTISGKTMPVAFDIIAKVSGNDLSGTANASIKRSDFNLTIPSVKFVASVDDQFTISASIVAKKATP